MLRDGDSASERKRGGWSQNRDTSPGVQAQEVLIAGDDEVSIATKREFQKLVVFGIATVGDFASNVDQLGGERITTDELQTLRNAEVTIEFTAGNNVQQLTEAGLRDKKLRRGRQHTEDVCRLAQRSEHRAYDQVVVADDPFRTHRGRSANDPPTHPV